MAWITPVTNRRSGLSRISRTDMNRIAGNINHVYDLISDLAAVQGVVYKNEKLDLTQFVLVRYKENQR